MAKGDWKKTQRGENIAYLIRSILRREPTNEDYNQWIYSDKTIKEIEIELKDSFEYKKYAINKDPLPGWEDKTFGYEPPPVKAFEAGDELTDVLALYPEAITKSDYTLAYQGYVNMGIDPAEASRMAIEDLGTIGKEWVKEQKTEADITKYIGEYPGIAKAGVGELGEALKKYTGELYREEAVPFLEQRMGARGLLDSGALNVAMMEAMERMGKERELQLAPLYHEATTSGQKMQYEDLLRKAAKAGVNLTTPSMFYQKFYQPSYGAYQTGLSQAWRGQQGELARAFEEAMSERTYGRQQQTQQGQLAGALLSILMGGGMGALAYGGWGGAGRGALGGLTGQYPYQYKY